MTRRKACDEVRVEDRGVKTRYFVEDSVEDPADHKTESRLVLHCRCTRCSILEEPELMPSIDPVLVSSG